MLVGGDRRVPGTREAYLTSFMVAARLRVALDGRSVGEAQMQVTRHICQPSRVETNMLWDAMAISFLIDGGHL